MKKNKMRFTINFNEDDPVQAKAARILNGLGRQKAFVIARAICKAYVEYDVPVEPAVENGADSESDGLQQSISEGVGSFE